MSNKDRFMLDTLRHVEWTSPSTGAKFTITEPNTAQYVKMMKINQAETDEVARLTKLIDFVWTELVRDPDTGRKVFTSVDVQALLDVKSLEEMLGPVNLLPELVNAKNLVTTPLN